MTMPVRIPGVPGGRAAPRGVAATPARTARPVPAPVLARTTAAFDMPAVLQGSTSPQTAGDEAGTAGGVPLSAGPRRVTPPPAVHRTQIAGGHQGSLPAGHTAALAPSMAKVVVTDPERTTR